MLLFKSDKKNQNIKNINYSKISDNLLTSEKLNKLNLIRNNLKNLINKK